MNTYQIETIFYKDFLTDLEKKHEPFKTSRIASAVFLLRRIFLGEHIKRFKFFDPSIKYYYPNGDCIYRTGDGYAHLIQNGKDVLEGVKAINCQEDKNGNYIYETKKGGYFVVRDGEDLLEDVKAIDC